MKKIIIASGYFNPLHKGHIDYLRKASKLGRLIVIVNNDKQVQLKGGIPFMNIEERMKIVEALYFVDRVIASIDIDGSVCETIKKIVKNNKKSEFIFAKGGDKTSKNIPEKIICDKLRIKIVDGLGKKIQSSSWLLKNLNKFKSK